MDYKNTPNDGYPMKPRRRRKNYSLVFLTGFIVIVIIFAVLSCTVLFQVTQIKVDGESVYKAADIAAAADIKPGQPLVTLKTSAVREKLTENFIYVDAVSVKKSFPATVMIEVIPSIPIASIETPDGYLYLSAGGKVLEKNSEPKEGTLIFTGAAFSPLITPGIVVDINAAKNPVTGEDLTADEKSDISIISAVLDIAGDNLGGLIERTDYIDISDIGDIKIMYDNRLELAVGGLSEIDYKSKFLKQIIDTKIGPNTYGKLMMLSSGDANFIDSVGLAYNEKKYQDNIAAKENADNEDTGEDTENDDTPDTDEPKTKSLP
jgi:cell division protein FtsQ